MSSGMEGAETSTAYSDPTHKHYQYEASLGWLPKRPEMADAVQRDETYAYLATLWRDHAAGTRWEYASVNTAILGWLVERVSGRTLADFLSDDIWSRMGASRRPPGREPERDRGRPRRPGLHAPGPGPVRDAVHDAPGRHLRPGDPGATPPSDHHRRPNESRGAAQGPSSRTHVAYQWDGVTAQGDFYKGGFGGQMLYVAPRKDVVIAYFGTNATLDAPTESLPLSKLVDALERPSLVPRSRPGPRRSRGGAPRPDPFTLRPGKLAAQVDGKHPPAGAC